VTIAYYTVLDTEQEQEALRSIRETVLKRVEELQERVRLGKSRESEILSTEAALAALDAEVERISGLIKTSREMLAFLTGVPADDLLHKRLIDEFAVPSSAGPLETHLASLNSRPDLNASEEAVRIGRGRVSYEKGGRLPTVDLEANYYPYRVGFLSDIDWDLLLTFNLPIFQGGATRGKIREAQALLKQSELSKQEAFRRAEREVRNAYEDLGTARKREAILRRAESKAEENFKVQTEEYRLGLVNNLDVLQTLRDWRERQREARLAHFQTKLAYARLIVATGHLPIEVNE
jgi:outer membrane protein TolC